MASLACVSEAQPCYKQTDEHVWGNFFVKPMTDSTCFGQWYGTLLYYKYKTGDTLFSFDTEVFYPFPHIGRAIISDVLMLDSLLIVSWESGAVYRILKMDHRGVVSEVPSALDQIPMLKYEGDWHGNPARKLNVVNDSIILMSNDKAIYSFHRSVGIIECVDSVSVPGGWSALDLYRDTIVTVSISESEARLYHVDAVGRIRYSATLEIDKDLWAASDVYFRYGNLYAKEGGYWRALLRTPAGFELAPGLGEGQIVGMVRPLFGNERVIIVGFYDEIRVYDKGFDLLCRKAPLVSLLVIGSGIYDDKVFLATSAGISTWIPDTSTTSITSQPVPNHHSGIRVWPNPSSSGMITVRSEESTEAIELCDGTGSVVYRTTQAGTE